jgi:hypothetical protein
MIRRRRAQPPELVLRRPPELVRRPPEPVGRAAVLAPLRARLVALEWARRIAELQAGPQRPDPEITPADNIKES